MNIPVPELIVASLIALVMVSTDTGGIASMIGLSTKASERITGTWTSYSPTRFGAMSIEFDGSGECHFRNGADETTLCKWEGTKNGRAKIEATVSGRDEVFSASVSGDYLVVREPGRETQYVRSDSNAAHERQKLVNGPSSFAIPWASDPGR